MEARNLAVIAVGALTAVSVALLFGVQAAAGASDVTVLAKRSLDGVVDVSPIPSSGRMAALQSGAVVILSATDLEPYHTFYPPRGRPTSIAGHPTRDLLFVGTSFGDILLLDPTTGTLLDQFGAATLEGNRVVAIKVSNSTEYVAAHFSNGTIVVFDLSLDVLFTADLQSISPFMWVKWGTEEALLFPSGIISLTVVSFGGPPVTYNSSLYPRPSWEGGWVMWPDGAGVALGPPLSGNRAYLTRDYGLNSSGFSSTIELGQEQLAYEPNRALLIGYGSDTEVLTIETRELVPVAFIDLDVPPDMAAWIGADSFAMWTRNESGILFLLGVSSNVSGPRLIIETPTTGQTVSGEIFVGGRVEPSSLTGTVLIRVDQGPWAAIEVGSAWVHTLDTRGFADGSHDIVAVFRGATNSSSPVYVPVIFNNGYSNSTLPIQVVFLSPRPLSRVSGGISLRIDVYNPNRADGTVDRVEVSWSGGLWNPAAPSPGEWLAGFDTTRVPNGQVSIRARAFDGRSFSGTAWLVLIVANDPLTTRSVARITAPADLEVVQGRFEVRGTLEFAPGSQGWLEFQIASGPWFLVPNVSGPLWSYGVDSNGSVDHHFGLCVRAATATGVGSPDCRTYLTPGAGIHRAPSVSIDTTKAVAMTGATVLLDVSGTAADDAGVFAVYVRADGGNWVLAAGGSQWVASFNIYDRGASAIKVEAMAFDGFEFSPIVATTIAVSRDDSSHTPPNESDGAIFAGMEPVMGIIVMLAIVGTALYLVGRRRKER